MPTGSRISRSPFAFTAFTAFSAFIILAPDPALACAACRPAVNARVYASDFLPNLLDLLLPILLIGLVAAAVHAWKGWASIPRAGKGGRRWKQGKGKAP